MAPTANIQVSVTSDDGEALDEIVKTLRSSIDDADGINVTGFNYDVDGTSQLRRALGEDKETSTRTKSRTTTGNTAQTAGAAKPAGAKKSE